VTSLFVRLWHVAGTGYLFAVTRFDDEIKTVRVIGVKQAGRLRRQTELKRRARILSRHPVVRKLAGRRAIKWRPASFRPTRRSAKRLDKNIEPVMQFIINAAERSPALQLIRRKAEARQHDHENEAIPDLQPPLDGFGNHGWGGTGVTPVVSGVAPETADWRMAAPESNIHLQFTSRDEIRRDAGFDGRDARATVE
jgi:hypothetical protein